MARQHCAPILVPLHGGAVALPPFGVQNGHAVSEADIQALVHTHPACLPIAEIDRAFCGPVPICMELNTPAGPIDNFLVTPSGFPVLVECKLWRNAEARREVVGQILDYAKELSRWSSADVQREVKRALRSEGNPLLDLVQAADPSIDETEFNDALTTNLRRGRVLLLIVGDGIREGTEAIAEYLKEHVGLHFSLGLVELPSFATPDGGRLMTPRVLARATIVSRDVVKAPDGYMLEGESRTPTGDSERSAISDRHQQFWAEFLDGLTLDDPEQSRPKKFRQESIFFMLPAQGGSSWITVEARKNVLELYLSSTRGTAGEFAVRTIADDWDRVRKDLGGDARLRDKDGKPQIFDSWTGGPLDDPEVRRRGFAWLADRVNSFVNVLRPRVRWAVADYAQR